jgi:hypothetical protein
MCNSALESSEKRSRAGRLPHGGVPIKRNRNVLSTRFSSVRSRPAATAAGSSTLRMKSVESSGTHREYGRSSQARSFGRCYAVPVP